MGDRSMAIEWLLGAVALGLLIALIAMLSNGDIWRD
jgi:hypothetical protein